MRQLAFAVGLSETPMRLHMCGWSKAPTSMHTQESLEEAEVLSIAGLSRELIEAPRGDRVGGWL